MLIYMYVQKSKLVNSNPIAQIKQNGTTCAVRWNPGPVLWLLKCFIIYMFRQQPLPTKMCW